MRASDLIALKQKGNKFEDIYKDIIKKNISESVKDLMEFAIVELKSEFKLMKEYVDSDDLEKLKKSIRRISELFEMLGDNCELE